MVSSSDLLATFAPISGAEAMIYLVDWHGKKAICKARIPKAYRNRDLDFCLRSKRTREEAEILHRAKLLGIDCPTFFFIDPVKTELIMEYIEGMSLRDLGAFHVYHDSIESKNLARVYREVGKYAGRLHSGKLIHGDLTTKNVILGKDNRIVLLDFGLSFVSDRIEDKAEDLHLLKQALKATHDTSRAAEIFDIVLEGYNSEIGENMVKRVISQIQSIEKRGRYARVD
jgi:Kae1-associated kinase Bud32